MKLNNIVASCLVMALLLTLASAGAAHALDVTAGADGGFLTAFQVLGPLPIRSAEEHLAGPFDGPRWSTVAGPGPMLDAGKSRRAKKGLTTLFAVMLRNDAAAAIRATLELGADGNMTVWLDGAQLGHIVRPYGALWDDWPLPITIPPGRHALVIGTEGRGSYGGEWRLAARIHDGRGASPGGLFYELPASAKSEAISTSATTAAVTRTPTATGYSAKVHVALTGSAPKGAKVPWVLTLAGGGGAGKSIASGSSGDPDRTVDVRLAKDGEVALTLTVGGSPRVIERIGYTRRWHELLATAASDLAGAKAHLGKGLDQGAIDSLEWNLDELNRLVVENIPDTKWLGQQIERVSGWMSVGRRGTDPLLSERGDFYRAYRSPYDGVLQPYSIHIPPRYDGKSKWPLVVGMHGIGSGSHYTLRRVLGKDRDKEGGEPDGKPMIRGNMPKLPDYGVITISAWGYHNSAYWFYGEDDVLRIAEETKRTYAIDDNRVYLTGLSLGGLGTYHVGSHFPDKYAALAPLGGFSSIKLYRELRAPPKAWWETVLIEQRDATSYAENGLHTPMSVVHGQFDNPAHAKAMTKRYEALGYKVWLDIPPLPHDVWQYSYGDGKMVKWLKQWVRPSAPPDIVFKTLSYRYTSAYWAHIDWIDDYTKAALIRLNVSDDGHKVVFHDLTNLRGITLDLSRPKLAAGPVELVLPGGAVLRAPTHDVVHLRRDGAAWTLASTSEPPAGWKRAGTSGPLDDIMFEPHVFVRGTADPNQTDMIARLVEEDRRYLRHVDHDVAFAAVDDTALTDADLASKNLVLYGNPSSNLVLKKALATGKIPLVFEDHALVVGNKRFEGDDVGVKLIYPSPWNPKKYVVIVAGVTRRGTLLSRYLPRFVPDVIVFDERVTARYGGRILVDREVRFGGFFGADWGLPKALR